MGVAGWIWLKHLCIKFFKDKILSVRGKTHKKMSRCIHIPKRKDISKPVNWVVETKKLQLPSGTWRSSGPAGGNCGPMNYHSRDALRPGARSLEPRRLGSPGRPRTLPHGVRRHPACWGQRRGRLPALPRFLAAGAAAEGSDAAVRGGGSARGSADAGWGGRRARRRRGGGVEARRCRPGRRAARLPSSAIRPPERSSVEPGLRSDLVLGTVVPEAPLCAWARRASVAIAHTNFELLVCLGAGSWATEVLRKSGDRQIRFSKPLLFYFFQIHCSVDTWGLHS